MADASGMTPVGRTARNGRTGGGRNGSSDRTAWAIAVRHSANCSARRRSSSALFQLFLTGLFRNRYAVGDRAFEQAVEKLGFTQAARMESGASRPEMHRARYACGVPGFATVPEVDGANRFGGRRNAGQIGDLFSGPDLQPDWCAVVGIVRPASRASRRTIPRSTSGAR